MTHPSADFPLNEELLQKATEIKEQWQTTKERLAKVEESKSRVSSAVFEKVKRDYQARLDDVRKDLLEKKKDVDRELKSLHMAEQKISKQLEEQKLTLEEMKFRNSLGEFSESDYQGQTKGIQEKVGKFEALHTVILQNIKRYEAIFEGVDGLLSLTPDEGTDDLLISEEDRTPAEKMLSSTLKDDEEPATDEEGYIIEEPKKGYFSSGEETGKIPAKKAQPAKRDVQPATGVKVVLVSGDRAGTEYFLKDTTAFGRATTNAVVVSDAKASRQHAQIQKKGKEYVLIDLNSSNGTFVGGERIDEYVLNNGDEFSIGDAVYQFQL